MTNKTLSEEDPNATAVDDIRRIREQLSAEFGNDTRALAEHAELVSQEYIEKLGLKLVSVEDSQYPHRESTKR